MPIADAVEQSLEARLVTRPEMFYRDRFDDHLFPLGQGQWGIPLLEADLVGPARTGPGMTVMRVTESDPSVVAAAEDVGRTGMHQGSQPSGRAR